MQRRTLIGGVIYGALAIVAIALTVACALVPGTSQGMITHAFPDGMSNADGTSVAAERVDQIRESDAKWPLGACLEVYGEEGKRVALSEVDPGDYNGFIVRVTDADGDLVSRINAAVDSGVLETLGDGSTFCTDSLDVLAQNFSETDIEFIEPNYNIYMCDEASASPIEGEGGQDQTDLYTIQAPDVWADEYTGAGVRVGVLDSGLTGTGNGAFANTQNYKHEDIDYSKVSATYNMTQSTNYDTPAPAPDDNGHGTFVAGEIFAKHGNNCGVSGIAYDAQVVPYKVFYSARGADGKVAQYGSITYVERAINHAINNKTVDVISMSLGASAYVQTFDQVCQRAMASGLIVVASAGNDSWNKLNYPAAFENVIGVSATSKTGEFDYGYSNYGKENVFIAAPGTNIAGLSHEFGSNGESNYRTMNGTSMACPQVSAMAALAKQACPSLDQSTFRELLKTKSVDKGEPGYDEFYGWGLINCKSLIDAAKGSDEVLAEGFLGEEGSQVRWSISGEKAKVPFRLTLEPVGESGEFDLKAGVPWSDKAGQITSVLVRSGVAAKGSIAHMFDGMTAVEKIDLGGLSVPAGVETDVVAAPLFGGLDGLRELVVGDGWKSSATKFPSAPANFCFDGWLSTRRNAQTSEPLQIFAASTANIPVGAATYTAKEHRYEVDESRSQEQSLLQAEIKTQVCGICGNELVEQRYVRPDDADLAATGYNGDVKWFLTNSDYKEAPYELVIYPFDGIEATLPHLTQSPGWNYPSACKVHVLDGVKASESFFAGFYGMSSCTEFDISRLDLSGTTSIDCLFEGCTSIKNLDLSRLDLSNVESAQRMLYGCESLESVNFGAFGNPSVSGDLTEAFSGCASLSELDLSNFNFTANPFSNEDKTRFTPNVQGAFNDCQFDKLILGDGWKTDYFNPDDRSCYEFPVNTAACGNEGYWKYSDGGQSCFVSVQDLAKSPFSGAFYAANHAVYHQEAVEPTCEEEGCDEFFLCTSCNTLFSDAFGFEYATKAPSFYDPLGHDFGEWTVVRDATSEEEGLERRECQREGCGASEERAIPKVEPTAPSGERVQSEVDSSLNQFTTSNPTASTIVHALPWDSIVSHKSISATVPLKITVVIGGIASTGDGDAREWGVGGIKAPTNYGIKNTGKTALSLKSISAVAGTEWKLVPGKTDKDHAGDPILDGLSGDYQALAMSVNGFDVCDPRTQSLAGIAINAAETYPLSVDARVTLSKGHAPLAADREYTLATLYYTVGVYE